MTNETAIPRNAILIGLTIPIALLLGYLMASPLQMKTLALVGLFLVALTLPLMMRWHHTLLILSWNASLIVFFLPGDPGLGTVMAGYSFFLSVLYLTVRREKHGRHINSVAVPLVLLVVVVVVTAMLTGGIGGRALGSDAWGAKRYLGVFGAILGYFALVAKAVPVRRRVLYATLFFATGVTSVISDLAYFAGPSLYFLFNFFPANLAYSQAMSQDDLFRLSGLSFAGLALFSAILVRYGVRELFRMKHSWRLGLLLLSVACGLLGGYRSVSVLMFFQFVFMFFLEGLWRTRVVWIVAAAGAVAAVFLVAFLPHMPLSVQRSLSFLPVDIDPLAKRDAMSTLDWRLQMWKVVARDVPDYLILGKGFTFSGTDYELMKESVRRGLFSSFEDTLITGNYHNGILTVLIPFGIFGLLAFGWFCAAGWRVLHLNFRNGPPGLRIVNTFLLAYFLSRLSFYLVLYGQFDLDLMLFTGVVGLSIALNNGVCRKPFGEEGGAGELEEAQARTEGG